MYIGGGNRFLVSMGQYVECKGMAINMVPHRGKESTDTISAMIQIDIFIHLRIHDQPQYDQMDN